MQNMGPYGPLFASRYTQRRFASQSEEDRRDIHAYIYNTSILKGSGEFCICEPISPSFHRWLYVSTDLHQRIYLHRGLMPGYRFWTG